ncbi:hypothetical protein LC085_14260 [Bacillus tianshenii]|uniref:hypothetical protein n=1 Tax=Sutcliffiella tianshenii TaxID=1463404 RepID=UPI001CD5111B|nr:hypothetical protein [Bacillus tianshenii]MCA1321082.1 hypothetical protein [Bacillus tianshenii]
MKRILCSLFTLVAVLIGLNWYGSSVAAIGQKDTWEYVIQTSLESGYSTAMPLPKQIRKNVQKGKWKEISYPIPPTDTFIRINENVAYAIDHQLNVYDRTANKILLPLKEENKKRLSKDMKKLHKNHYGELITWKDANQLLPRYSVFKVLDLDTGLSFEVQRRAGSYHADVQPLTHDDTKIMKKIYRGTWSWDRRAILVLSETGQFAGSMHGMPHGQGALKNGFPGHFCIHFQDSITHKSRKMDHAHSIMIKKASGEWLDHTQKLSPQEIVDATVLSIHQHDWFILSPILDDRNRILLDEHLEELEEIELIKRLSDLPKEDGSTRLTYPITVKLQVHRKSGTTNKSVTFDLYRPTIEEPWTVDLEKLLEQL